MHDFVPYFEEVNSLSAPAALVSFSSGAFEPEWERSPILEFAQVNAPILNTVARCQKCLLQQSCVLLLSFVTPYQREVIFHPETAFLNLFMVYFAYLLIFLLQDCLSSLTGRISLPLLPPALFVSYQLFFDIVADYLVNLLDSLWRDGWLPFLAIVCPTHCRHVVPILVSCTH